MDFTLYWFMLPVSALIATTAMLSGIGGAALFTPLFIIIFPLLGPEYPLETTVAAIGTALLTETFGFSSGFVGYFRRKLVDLEMALKFLRISVPVAILGAVSAHLVAEWILIGGYAVLVAGLSIILVFFHHAALAQTVEAATDAEPKRHKTLTDSRGREYRYTIPSLGPLSALITSAGAFLTGMLSVGIGEVIMPQLTKRGVPVAVAAASSVAVVIVTVASASFTLIGQLIGQGGLDAVPWNLVCWTVPGVIIGGQIGPRLQGLVSQTAMERAIGALFFTIAIAMGYIALRRAGIL